MTPPTSWHPTDSDLQSYVDGGATLPVVASVEAHVVRCHDCRQTLRAGVPQYRLEAVRAAVHDRVDAVEGSRLQRFLERLGVPEADVRALLAAPALRRAWVLAVVASVVLSLLALGDTSEPDAVFLLFAPLLPAVCTAFAYAPALDPAFQLVAAVPYGTGRLLLTRSLAVAVTAFAGAGVAAVLLPGRDAAAVAWLLPAVALTLLALALSSWFGTAQAAGVVAAGWVASLAGAHSRGVDLTAALGPAVQGVSAVVAIASLAVVLDQQRRLGGARA